MFGNKQKAPERDLWAGCGSSYVGRYRARLDTFAKNIEYRLWQKVYTAYDADGSCVVVRTDEEILARIRVNGEAGIPYRAIIRTDLDNSFHAEMRKALQGVRVEFQPLRPYLVGH